MLLLPRRFGAGNDKRYAVLKVTYDLTISVARTLARLNPNITFIYVSGRGTDSTERGRLMWWREKGGTESMRRRRFRSRRTCSVQRHYSPAWHSVAHGLVQRVCMRSRWSFDFVLSKFSLIQSLPPSNWVRR